MLFWLSHHTDSGRATLTGAGWNSTLAVQASWVRLAPAVLRRQERAHTTAPSGCCGRDVTPAVRHYELDFGPHQTTARLGWLRCACLRQVRHRSRGVHHACCMGQQTASLTATSRWLVDQPECRGGLPSMTGMPPTAGRLIGAARGWGCPPRLPDDRRCPQGSFVIPEQHLWRGTVHSVDWAVFRRRARPPAASAGTDMKPYSLRRI